MAAFCRQCALYLGLPSTDMVGLAVTQDWALFPYRTALCEHCGPTVVDRFGTCVSAHCATHQSGTAEERAEHGVVAVNGECVWADGHTISFIESVAKEKGEV